MHRIEGLLNSNANAEILELQVAGNIDEGCNRHPYTEQKPMGSNQIWQSTYPGPDLAGTSKPLEGPTARPVAAVVLRTRLTPGVAG
jgi:hypothetical protein